MSITVAKFGGSSLADAGQFQKVKEILSLDPARRYVVASAPGKRFSGDEKVTDLLYRLHGSQGEAFEDAFNALCKRYGEIVENLGLSFPFREELIAIRDAFLAGASRDFAASRGEFLNAKILAAYLGYDFLDAALYIRFKEDGSFDGDTSYALLGEAMKAHPRAVIPGFYGSMPDGSVKTFSRGGSDITGAIAARAIMADLYENWTDVSGILMTDPRIVESPRVISTISYRELRELSYMGATVMHEDAIFPVKKADIPINIKNTNRPSDPGTLISAHADMDNCGIITGIAGKKGFSVITIEKDMMNAELGFGRRVMETLENYHIPFEHLPTGIDTMSVVVSSDSLAGKEGLVLSSLQEAVRPDAISLEDGLAMLAVVGRGMAEEHGVIARICSALESSHISIRMIDMGSSRMNIIVAVAESDYALALQSIYNAF